MPRASDDGQLGQEHDRRRPDHDHSWEIHHGRDEIAYCCRRRKPGRWAMKAEQLLEHAAGIITRRRRDYGDPTLLFEQIARRWSLTLGIDVSAAQTVACLIDVKMARLAHDPKHSDSITDIAGYAGVLAEVLHDA
jgi:hypothetical protein